jgi:hypothetical protein
LEFGFLHCQPPLVFFFLPFFFFSSSSSSPCFFFFLRLQLLLLFHCCLLPRMATSTTNPNLMRRSFAHLLLLPHYNCSYATKNQIDQGHLSPLCFLMNWRLQPCSQEFMLLGMAVVALATIVTTIPINNFFLKENNKEKYNFIKKHTRNDTKRGHVTATRPSLHVVIFFFSFQP